MPRLASNDCICTGRYLAISVVFIQADIERLLLSLRMTVSTSTKSWLRASARYVWMQARLSSSKFLLPRPLPEFFSWPVFPAEELKSLPAASFFTLLHADPGRLGSERLTGRGLLWCSTGWWQQEQQRQPEPVAGRVLLQYADCHFTASSKIPSSRHLEETLRGHLFKEYLTKQLGYSLTAGEVPLFPSRKLPTGFLHS